MYSVATVGVILTCALLMKIHRRSLKIVMHNTSRIVTNENDVSMTTDMSSATKKPDSNIFEAVFTSSALDPLVATEVEIVRSHDESLGFNIVGGTDRIHIPGHVGIFVSCIRPDTIASKDGRIRVGDRIVEVNGIPLSKKTHQEAVDILRNTTGSIKLLIETNAERLLLSKPSNILPSPTQATNHPQSTQSGRTVLRTTTNIPQESFSSGSDLPSSSKSKTPSQKAQTMTATVAASSEDAYAVNNDLFNPAELDFAPKERSQRATIHDPILTPFYGVVDANSNTADSFTFPSGHRIESSKEQSPATTPTPAITTTSPAPPTTPANNVHAASLGSSSGSTGLTPQLARISILDDYKPLPLPPNIDDDDDRASTVSMAPSTYSIVDDVPKTPKKPISILDPASPSHLTEALFISVGVLALGVGALVALRYFKRHQ